MGLNIMKCFSSKIQIYDHWFDPDSSPNLNSFVTFPRLQSGPDCTYNENTMNYSLFLQKTAAGDRTSDLPGGVPSALTIQLL